MVSELKGLSYAIVCVVLYSLFNIYFKVVSVYEINSLLFLATSLIFASLTLLLKGGRTSLIFTAIKDPLTWLYSVTFILECFFALELLKYILATEMVLVSRLSVLISVLFALVFFKRTNLKKGIWGLPLVGLGMIIVFFNIDENLKQVIYLALGLSITKSLYYISIELNKVAHKSKNYLSDFSVLGYILGITSVILMFLLYFLSKVTTISYVPTIGDFESFNLFILAGFYGVFGVTALRYLEFKSVQSIKSEIFMCILTVVPLVTLVFESMASYIGLIKTPVEISPLTLLANLLIISGGLLIVILRVASEELSDEKDRLKLVQLMQNTLVFVGDDIEKASEVLEVSSEKINEILANNNFKITKLEYKKIQENFNKKVAMADHLTGLCNKLEFQTQLKHINKNESNNLFFIDLNKFKPVNDTYGHDAGDFILHGIARRLENLFKNSLLTRMGGDEFVLLISNSLEQEIESLKEQIIKEIEREFVFKGEHIAVSASIGVANYPKDTKNPDSLIKLADKNMYRDKDNR